MTEHQLDNGPNIYSEFPVWGLSQYGFALLNTKTTIPVGFNKEAAEGILGSSEDWAKATEGTCLGLVPLPCPMLALAVGAVIVLLVALR